MTARSQNQPIPHISAVPPQLVLPPLTRETIERAREGLAYARNPDVKHMIQQALLSSANFAEGGCDYTISGGVRRRVLRSLIHTLFEVKVEFPEHIPTTPALLAANHLNHIDPFLLLSEVSGHPYYHILGDARTLYNKWWKLQFLRYAKGVIPLERIWKEEIAVIEGAKAGRKDLADLANEIQKYIPTGNSIESLRRLDRIIQGIFERGDGIILFPEGRLGNVEGQLQLPLKRGAVIYALRAGVPIVPVAIIGTKNLYFRKELTVRFGKPLIFPRSQRPKPREVQAALDELQAALLALLPQDYHEPEGSKLFRQFLNRMFW